MVVGSGTGTMLLDRKAFRDTLFVRVDDVASAAGRVNIGMPMGVGFGNSDISSVDVPFPATVFNCEDNGPVCLLIVTRLESSAVDTIGCV